MANVRAGRGLDINRTNIPAVRGECDEGDQRPPLLLSTLVGFTSTCVNIDVFIQSTLAALAMLSATPPQRCIMRKLWGDGDLDAQVNSLGDETSYFYSNTKSYELTARPYLHGAP